MNLKTTLRWSVPLLLVAAGTGYLLFWPLPLDPVVWTPPRNGHTDAYAQRTMQADVERLFEDAVLGPETVITDPEGRIYAGLQNGRVIRVSEESPAEVVAHTAGRPLGLAFDAAGGLIVADLSKGLLRVGTSGLISTLATEVEGRPFRFSNDVAVANDGRILLTDSSWRRGPEGYLDELIEHRPHGRLLEYDPRHGTTRVLLNNLYFPNGVAISADQSFVLVSETAAYRVTRLWLTGPKAGTTDVFIDDLPGFPDGISRHGDRYWLAIYAPRSRLLDALMPYPFLRKVLARIPQVLLPKPSPSAWILGLDDTGQLVHSLRDSSGHYGPVSSVVQHGDVLYLGSLTDTAIGKLAVPHPAKADAGI